MENQYTYTCPHCSKECVVQESWINQNIICPHCSLEFYATPPKPQEVQSRAVLPEKLPFFKSGRRKLLEKKFSELVEDGEFSDSDEQELTSLAAALKLDLTDLSKIKKEKFLVEFEPLQRCVESTFVLTDEQLVAFERLEKKYGVRLNLSGFKDLYRAIYVLESEGQLPSPISSDLMLDSDELVYYRMATTWHQTRVKTHGYSGTSVSLPSGIKGVRFRFGGYTPIRSEEITPLSSGTLYITSKRLLFNGDSRNTAILLKKIVNGHVFSDSLKIEKQTGKADFFSMNAPQARFFLALIEALKR
jgi:hypothetical protein